MFPLNVNGIDRFKPFKLNVSDNNYVIILSHLLFSSVKNIFLFMRKSCVRLSTLFLSIISVYSHVCIFPLYPSAF